MREHEKLFKSYLNVLDNYKDELEQTALKAKEFEEDEKYVKLLIKSGIAKKCKYLFIKTYEEIYGEQRIGN